VIEFLTKSSLIVTSHTKLNIELTFQREREGERGREEERGRGTEGEEKIERER